MHARVLVCGVLSLATVLSADAEVKLHRLFSDNGILQRGVKVPVRGTSDQADAVSVKFGGQTVTATPREGKWKAELPAMEATATPHDLIVTQGEQTLTRTNMVVGDVWICGGQSNMQMPVNRADTWKETIPASRNRNLRLFTVERSADRRGLPEPKTELDGGEWMEANQQTVPDFSAVGYYFGRDLEKVLKVPIGLISCNMNGSMAERWMSERAIDENPQIKEMSAPQGKGDLYNAMLVPLTPFAIKGAIWYQGEGNGHRPYIYRHVLAAMIRNWRDTFGQGDFPFLIVELPPFLAVNDPDLEWAVVRESQQWAAKTLANVETISTIDVGDPDDLHPQTKQPIGARLAIAARVLACGERITPTGPRYDRVMFQGNQAIIQFKNIGGGLVAGSCVGSNTSPREIQLKRVGECKDGNLLGFTMAGEDRKFHAAQARVTNNTVIVICDATPYPHAVRFGWANYPIVNLWNKDGLPAHPFRTDDWEVTPQHVK